MGDRFIVIALTGATGDKHVGCNIVPEDAVFPGIYTVVHGPADEQSCRSFIGSNCAGAPGSEASRAIDVKNPDKVSDLIGRPVRLIKSGDVYTTDHVPQRVNIVHDQGRIVGIWFG